MRPPSPCRLTLLRSGNTLTASWVRRSHKGWTWIDGVGVADDAFPERYRVTASGPLGELTAEATVPSHSFAAAQLPGSIGQAITIKVVTIGPSALSRDASITITL